MSYRIVKQVLELADKSPEEKLYMIEKVINRIETIDRYAHEQAQRYGRKVTIEDRNIAAKRLAWELGIKYLKNEAEIFPHIEKGASYLMANQTDAGGWGRTQINRMPDRIHSLLPKKVNGPVSSAWVTTMSIATLRIIHKYHNPLPEFKKSIENGCRWLVESQNPDGSWNEVDPRVCPSEKNVIQTGMAITGLCQSAVLFETEKYHDAICRGLDYIRRTFNQQKGGWGMLAETNHGECDSKATSMAVIAYLFATKLLGIAFRNGLKVTTRGIRWLIDNQSEMGDWGFVRTQDSFLFGTYYGIEAIEIYRLLYNAQLSQDRDLRMALKRTKRKALDWYISSNQLVKVQDEYEWAWVNGNRTNEVANTAAAVTVLLDCAEDDFLFVIRKGVEYLLEQRGGNHFWEGDTSLVLMALLRYVYPESRLHNFLQSPIE